MIDQITRAFAEKSKMVFGPLPDGGEIEGTPIALSWENEVLHVTVEYIDKSQAMQMADHPHYLVGAEKRTMDLRIQETVHILTPVTA